MQLFLDTGMVGATDLYSDHVYKASALIHRGIVPGTLLSFIFTATFKLLFMSVYKWDMYANEYSTEIKICWLTQMQYELLTAIGILLLIINTNCYFSFIVPPFDFIF